jgi:GTP-binding protein YchF
MDLGIIGLALAGKSALFHAVTRGHAHTGSFAAAEPNIGTVKIPDERLDRLSALIKSKKTTYIEARYLDFPGGFSVRGEGPARTYLAALGQCDALVHVVRTFENPAVPHPAGGIDPARDLASVDMELAFADLQTLENRHERLEIQVRSARPGEREAGERELALVQRLRAALEGEVPLRAQELTADERRTISGFNLLTGKPVLVVVNAGEDDSSRLDEIANEFAERWRGPKVEVTAICGKLEQELAELSDDEAAEFRRDMGLPEGTLARMLLLSQQVLDQISIFTVGEQEARAWAVPAGAVAPEAAGKIHTDMERGFIRAEVIRWQELLDCGSYAEARKRGLLRTEGKQYIPQDGDVMHILFNV